VVPGHRAQVRQSALGHRAHIAPGVWAAVLYVGSLLIPAVTKQWGTDRQQALQLKSSLGTSSCPRTPSTWRPGGETASLVDQGQVTADRLPIFIGGMVGVAFLLLRRPPRPISEVPGRG